MVQVIYIMMFLMSFSYAEEAKKEPQKISTEKFKIIQEKRQEVLKAVQKAAFDSQPDVLYNKHLKNEVMRPNIEPVKNRVYGKKGVRNKIVLFADFACGHCKDASKDIKARIDENKDLVNLTYIFYPLDGVCNKSLKGKLSSYSCPSAKLALCAEKENKLWKAIDYLYAHQEDSRKQTFDINNFVKKMSSDLKIKGLDTCINSKWVEERLNNEQLVYKNLKIPGTPIVLLNNRRLVGVYKDKDLFAKFIKYVDLKEHPKGK